VQKKTSEAKLEKYHILSWSYICDGF